MLCSPYVHVGLASRTGAYSVSALVASNSTGISNSPEYVMPNLSVREDDGLRQKVEMSPMRPCGMVYLKLYLICFPQALSCLTSCCLVFVHVHGFLDIEHYTPILC